MGRPKGSKNKPKTTRPVVGTPNGGANVPSRSDTSPPQDEVATAETLASGYPAQGGAPTPPAVGDTVTHPDGRTGEVTAVEPRGDAHAVCVRWAGDDDDSQYTPIDWRELQGALATEPAPAPPSDHQPVRALPSQSRSLDVIGHEMAEAQADLDELETAKAAIVKDYGKRIGTAAGRVSELAAEYRQAERREEIDYDLGVVNVYSNRTGELIATRPLADSERQQVLPLDHPSKPPEPEEDDDEEIEPVLAEELDLEDGNPEAEEA